MLSVRELRAGYGAIEVLHGISFDVSPGEIVALLGPNGAGKTTTLRAMVGAIRPFGGRVVFQGKDLTGSTPDRCMRAGVSLVPEGRGIFGDLTVRENLQTGCWTVEGDGAANRRIGDALEIFPALRERMTQRAGTLSGGEQQMLAIARALVAGPKLLLIDEMSQGLAPIVVKQLFAALRDVRAVGTTILLVEQQVENALSLADRAIVLENGEIAASGSPGELTRSPALLTASYLGAAGGAGSERASTAVEERPVTLEKILVPLTPAEKRRLQTQAETAGVSVGDLLAQALRDWKPAKRRAPIPSHVAELSRATAEPDEEAPRRSTAKRVLAAAAALLLVALLAFQGYGMWARRRPPQFGKGGAFGAPATGEAIPTAAPTRAATAGTAGAAAQPAESAARGPSATRAADPALLQPPAVGTWWFSSGGEGERVKLGSGPSPCSWKLDDQVRLEIKRSGPRDMVYDWTLKKDTHQERHLHSFRADGIYLTYAAARVVCMNYPQTTESDYSPPFLRLHSRLTVGDSWRSASNALRADGTVERSETLTATVKRRESVTVPAGTFDAYVVESVTTITGSQEGTLSTTDWFVPSLGMWVKQIVRTDVASGNATFHSNYLLQLLRTP